MNGTGPNGQGPQTGRGMGRCASGERMFWCGRRMMGRGGFNLSLSPKDQLKALDEEEKALLSDLEMVKAEKKALQSKK
ncbi:MAG: DUF5320 domain-containing protein [Candidatus Cloacimonetes bacterium]|nr:DUF5320 domain-containing protein [Candidatus Cloacimonadota bacterium]